MTAVIKTSDGQYINFDKVKVLKIVTTDKENLDVKRMLQQTEYCTYTINIRIVAWIGESIVNVSTTTYNVSSIDEYNNAFETEQKKLDYIMSQMCSHRYSMKQFEQTF